MNITQLPPVMALAYLGDARHSLFVRRMLVLRGIVKSGELNKASLEYVTATSQAKMFSKIEHLLTEEEKGVYKRAYNSTHLNKPKNASGKDYRIATGFEAVIGMLHLLGEEDRLEYLLEISHSEDNENDTED